MRRDAPSAKLEVSQLVIGYNEFLFVIEAHLVIFQRWWRLTKELVDCVSGLIGIVRDVRLIHEGLVSEAGLRSDLRRVWVLTTQRIERKSLGLLHDEVISLRLACVLRL